MAKRTCTVASCDRDARGRYCDGHAARLRRHGDLREDEPLKVYSPRSEPHDQRFWRYVDKLGPTHPTLGQCWDWTGGRNGNERGRFAAGGGRVVYAYHFAYELLVGPVPDGLHLDHLCRRPSCVNPAHLEPVTQRVNNLRGHTPAARNATKTHCQNGHEFTPENTWLRATGKRDCRTCGLGDQRARRAAKRARADADHVRPDRGHQ